MRSLRIVVAMLTLAVSCVFTATASAQAYHPLVTMSVTLPDGQTKDLSAPESGLATVTVSSHEYGLRPTMRDDRGSEVVVTLFDMGGKTGVVREIGEVDLKTGGPAMSTRTAPVFKIQLKNVAPGKTVAT